MATAGQPLTTPDSGYQRIDVNTSNVTTNMGMGSIPESLNGSALYSGIGGYANFNVRTSKLRIISMGHPRGNTNAKIKINGNVVGSMSNYTASRTGYLLVFDTTFPNSQEMSVELVVDEEGEFEFDAIDIDEIGEFKPYSPVLVPTNLTATAGDSKVTLSWAAVTGATGYNVKRATTAGGPYTPIASNESGTSYVDSSVINGATYYYVVTAITADGESANSNEASATPAAVVTPPPTTGNKLLRVTVIDSSDHDYQLPIADIDAFVNWYMKHTSADTAGYMLTKKVGTQNSREYLAFDKIISFEVLELN
ncbi:hypothetical protein [Sporomusa malonica]|uniref:Fibronectin type-III domain-containing protein n=1 Tax=Sporomusa malonica TaxID=112901 RepID=A0A1W2F7P8_9FIRM|nr:hypothetical protein [Sporomusa malonica]SMD17929.1 hypothetical protein SAMN04488500_1554 [Sporomusa malonica]